MGKLQHEVIENLATVTTQYDEIQVNLMKWGNNPPKPAKKCQGGNGERRKFI